MFHTTNQTTSKKVNQKQLKQHVKASQQDVSPCTVETCIACSYVQLTKSDGTYRSSIAGLRHQHKMTIMLV